MQEVNPTETLARTLKNSLWKNKELWGLPRIKAILAYQSLERRMSYILSDEVFSLDKAKA